MRIFASQWTVTRKVVVGFGALLFVILIICVMGMYSMRSNYLKAEGIVSKSAPSVEIMANFRKNFWTILAAERGLLLRRYKAEVRQAQYKVIDDAIAVMIEDKKTYESFTF